jgi:hypothetical protein
MPKRLASPVCCAASLLAGAALAQPPAKAEPPTTVAPVTVEGATPKTITAQSHAFVQGTAAAPNPEIGQISRWHEPVCVQVEGLAQAAQAEEIKARIESVAQAVGLKAARAGCKANVEIVFSDDPQGVMNEVAKRREDLLGYYHRHDHDRLKIVSHPIQAWYKTATRGEGSNDAGIAFASYTDHFGKAFYSGDFPARTAGNYRTDDPDEGAPTGCTDAPHFTSCLTSEFQNVFIVADGKALKDKAAGVAADYLVMLALSQPKSLDGCSALPSILDLTAKTACPGRDAPDGLTPADAAWLTALYGSDGRAKGDGEKSDIANRMAHILIKASTAAPAGGGR